MNVWGLWIIYVVVVLVALAIFWSSIFGICFNGVVSLLIALVIGALVVFVLGFWCAAWFLGSANNGSEAADGMLWLAILFIVAFLLPLFVIIWAALAGYLNVRARSKNTATNYKNGDNQQQMWGQQQPMMAGQGAPGAMSVVEEAEGCVTKKVWGTDCYGNRVLVAVEKECISNESMKTHQPPRSQPMMMAPTPCQQEAPASVTTCETTSYQPVTKQIPVTEYKQVQEAVQTTRQVTVPVQTVKTVQVPETTYVTKEVPQTTYVTKEVPVRSYRNETEYVPVTSRRTYNGNGQAQMV